MTHFLKDYNILPKKVLHSSLWVSSRLAALCSTWQATALWRQFRHAWSLCFSFLESGSFTSNVPLLLHAVKRRKHDTARRQFRTRRCSRPTSRGVAETAPVHFPNAACLVAILFPAFDPKAQKSKPWALSVDSNAESLYIHRTHCVPSRHKGPFFKPHPSKGINR